MTATRAAVCRGIGKPLVIETLELAPPRADEVQVRIAATGVCHSDLSTQNGTMPSAMPLVLGHEGVGIVEEVGEDVTTTAVGDHVVLAFVSRCGRCYWCQRGQPHLCGPGSANAAFGLLADGTSRFTSASTGEPVYQMGGTGTFSERTVVSASAAVPIPRDIPLEVAAMLGCAVLTGAGAALNTASVEKGDTVVVLGCGGVGLSVIQGARLAGAGQIVAVDRGPAKLALATQAGATAVIDAGMPGVRAKVKAMTGGRGGDVVFEAVGSAATIDDAVALTRRGGETVIVGVPGADVRLEVPAFLGLVYEAKTIKGCWYGSCDPARDVPMLVEHLHRDELRLAGYISRRIGLDDLNEAFAAIDDGRPGRSVVVF